MNTDRSIHNRRGVPTALLWGALITAAASFGAGCSSSSDPVAPDTSLQGRVAGPSGVAVAGATVYLIPTSSVSTAEITGAGVLAGSTLGFDEPLEDAVANSGTTFARVTTSSNGDYRFDNVADGKFFVYVAPGMNDLEHFPGGSLCRQSVAGSSLRATTQNITVSSSPTATATYTGMTTCLSCHAEYDTEKLLAHRLGFRVPGVSSPLQDTSYHPEIDEGLEFFLDATVYTDGTPVYMYDFTPTRGFDKFKTTLTDPTGSGGVVAAIEWLWRDSGTTDYKITIENVGNPTDPNSPAERIVQLTYGGAVQKQRYMIEWPGLNGLYPLLQHQTDGDDSRYDRTRRQFRDYHLDFYWDQSGTPNDVSDDLIATPSITRNISRNCLGCHAGGYEQYTDPVTMEVLAHTIQDPNGEYDIDGDGLINDLNTGCENCHGAGSDHVTANAARYMVSPEYLSPSRSNQLCGRCHNRQEGADAIGGDHPLNAAGEWPEPGISRAEFLAEHVKPTVMGPKESKYWPDFKHPKSHHQQYPDWVKSAHYRNEKQLLTCFDCHDMHGGTGHERALVADPHEPDTQLCMNCHGATIVSTAQHTLNMVGVTHGAATASCIDCHMNKTSKSGSGGYGFLLSPPTGTATDVTETYFDNDISSHVFDVPGKTNVGVQGVVPASAMPIPYTQACATCHDPSFLQHM